MLDETIQSLPSASKFIPIGLVTIGSEAKRLTSKPSATLKLARSASGSVAVALAGVGAGLTSAPNESVVVNVTTPTTAKCIKARHDPAGVAAISRWLSAAIPPERKSQRRIDPEGVAEIVALGAMRSTAVVAATPSGSVKNPVAHSGGVAARNPRLMAGIPS